MSAVPGAATFVAASSRWRVTPSLVFGLASRIRIASAPLVGRGHGQNALCSRREPEHHQVAPAPGDDLQAGRKFATRTAQGSDSAGVSAWLKKGVKTACPRAPTATPPMRAGPSSLAGQATQGTV